MNQIRTLLNRAAVAAFFVAAATPARAQSFTGVAPSGRVFANAGASSAPGSWVTATAWFDRAFCTTNNMVPVRQGGTWSCASMGSVIQAWDADLDALAALSGTGIAARTAANTWATRTLQQPAAGLTITNPGGVAGDPTFALANDLAALESLAATGFAVRTGTDTWAQRSLANATAGITWTNPNGVSGNPTPVLANDLAAVEGLSGTGCTARTATDTWDTRTITGTANEITVTNGDCVAGNPMLSLPSALTFTGKTITGGTFSAPTISGGTIDNASLGPTTPNQAQITNLAVLNNFRVAGSVTPAQITANQDDYTATNGADSCANRTVLRLSTDATRSITGLSCGGVDAQIKILHNIGSFDIVLASEDVGSTAANRLALNSNTTVAPASAVTLRYDGTSSRWRPIASAGSAGGGGSGTVTSVAISSSDHTVSGSPITSSGTITLNVANDAITNAKLANMANNTIKCRQAGSTGDPQDCTGAQIGPLLSGIPYSGFAAAATASQSDVQMATSTSTILTPGRVQYAPHAILNMGTATVASGTAVDYTGLPSDVKQITVTFSSISNASGGGALMVQIGDSGGIETTGYNSGAIVAVSPNAVAGINATNGFLLTNNLAASSVVHGSITLTLLDSTDNTWVASTASGLSNTAAAYAAGGSKALSAVLDRVRITWSNGTDTFDSGKVNIAYKR